MSFDHDPPPLPPNGYLLDELGYLEEPKAALSINLSPPTLTEYRKAGIGPDYTIVGRVILYSRTNLQKWLNGGGTRAFESGPEPTTKARRQTKPVAKSSKQQKAKLAAGELAR